MKVVVNNPNNIVSDAFLGENNDLSFSLFINTVERGVYPDSESSSGGWKDKCSEISLCYYPEEDNCTMDTVTIIFDKENERKYFWQRFSLMCKDQLWLLFVNEKVYKNG